MAELVVTRWHDRSSGMFIEAVAAGEHYVFAVRRPGGECLNRQGDFEIEPSPSHRDREFLARCRWGDFEAAARALKQAAQQYGDQ